jgi:hypothetical protein
MAMGMFSQAGCRALRNDRGRALGLRDLLNALRGETGMIRNATEGVIRVHEKNPHYYEYKGKEILLITSAEHYGAVISRNFDYVRYFDALAEYGLNYTRIYPGTFRCPDGKWMPEDMMSPDPEGTIVPWMRSDMPGYYSGGNKFDLDAWDPEFFLRLRDFLAEADRRDIIVEICFFNTQHGDAYWKCSPLHKDANIQGVGDCSYIDFQTLDNEPLVRAQLKYIEKLVLETNSFDNVIYEFCDEPTSDYTNSRKACQWIDRQIDLVMALEENLPKKHLLAQQLEIGINYADDDRVAVLVTQYITLSFREIGGTAALQNCYGYNKPIEMNETAYVGSWIKEETHDLTAISRLEAWEFMVGGGAGFNQLNGYFLVSNPSGESAANREILAGLRNLRTFMEDFDYIKMTRDFSTVKGISIGARVSSIAEKGRQYAIYIHHSFPYIGNHSYYIPEYGSYNPSITLRLEKGKYAITFIQPATLKVLGEIRVESCGGETVVDSPAYDLDLAVKIVRAA